MVYNDSERTNEEIDLKRRLVEATDAVRKKFQTLKNRDIEQRLILDKVYEPITKPLKDISEIATDAKSRLLDPPIAPSLSSKKPQSESISLTSPITTKRVYKEVEEEDQEDNPTFSQSSFMPTPPDSSISGRTSTSSMSERSSDAAIIHSLPNNYIEDLRSNKSGYDTIYGIRIDPDSNKLLMGNAEVRFVGNTITFWRGNKKLKSVQANSELYDLLFLKLPPVLRSESKTISHINIIVYGDILKLTNAVYRDYDVKKGINDSRSKKYLEVIKPAISYGVKTRSKHEGHGIRASKLPTQKVFNYSRRAVDYVYWNKPKELVDRLRLLWSSKMAGHTGHDNEILSIIEELREEGIVH